MGRNIKQDCQAILGAGLRAVDPSEAVKKYVHLVENDLTVAGNRYSLEQYRNLYVLGAGKASAAMAAGLENVLGERLCGGLVIVKYGYTAQLRSIRSIEAGHPVPDESGLRGARELVALAETFEENDLVFCLISGGGSALLPMPVPGISLRDKQETTRLLLESGASIHEINTVRKHLSAIKGGGLAAAVAPATLISLILSDVIGNNLASIASGPTVPDESTYQDCIQILIRYTLLERIPAAVRTYLEQGAAGEKPETRKRGDPAFSRSHSFIIGSNSQCLEAAAAEAQHLGYHTLILSSFIEGESREAARLHAAILKELLSSGNPVPLPACVISGGETTVTVRGRGCGGRNQEFVLACGMEISGWEGAAVFSANTDGTDGPTDAAGAFADWRMIERAARKQLNPTTFLEENDSYHFFEQLGDLVITGPTRTNVMDMRLLLAVQHDRAEHHDI
ncbi:MAG TPA: glycerate kinase [Thermodesulfobacteriota bacterium]|nr:glycerate kinase [Thermodesulfobacteriota bacterium]HNU71632.1 glycerate kinase [Thermodesulfobacteriota bacterium]HOC39214.1 glycerate kinase [Thermodesulfobacteriota bacterium]